MASTTVTPCGEEAIEPRHGAGDELVVAGGARRAHRRQDAAAGLLDLEVRLPWARRSNSCARDAGEDGCACGSTRPGRDQPAAGVERRRRRASSRGRSGARRRRRRRARRARTHRARRARSPRPLARSSGARSIAARRCSSTSSIAHAHGAARATPVRRGEVERLLVAGVGVAHDAHAGIGRQHALEAARRARRCRRRRRPCRRAASSRCRRRRRGGTLTQVAPAAVLTSAFRIGQSAIASEPSSSPRSRGWARRPSRSRGDRGR